MILVVNFARRFDKLSNLAKLTTNPQNNHHKTQENDDFLPHQSAYREKFSHDKRFMMRKKHYVL
ncbi:MAG: hypothetical protein Q4D61_06935 [Cardiobacteriaceae bacterium]|nr:hypothetical protein [Cardiobacteriaceae bacterium]